MARPIKDNADYFTHDKDMRNDARIKALRRKFPLVGYYTWNMLLEVLTDASDFTIKYNDLQIELLAGDFEVDPDQLKEVIEYLLKLELLVLLDDFIFSPKHIERFSGLIDKRNRQRTVFQTAKTQEKVVSDSESTQSRVEYSKVDKSKVKENKVKEEVEIFFPFTSDDFKNQWEVWKKFRREQHNFKYKGNISEQAALKELSELSGNNEENAVKIIHQSISKSWKGFFELKNGKQNTNTDNAKFGADLDSLIARKYGSTVAK